MLFNTLDFAIFLPIVFSIYWLLKNQKAQNGFLILASYYFYGCWDYRFLSLIIISSALDYTIGITLHRSNDDNRRRWLLLASICINLSFLVFFKYCNFFLDSFSYAFSLFGLTINSRPLTILLPVGISFYTFQTLSYTIDVYRRKITATSDPLAFFAFVSFFPQLVAGPIERAKSLLPQFEEKRTFDYSKAADGMRQILWGLFKKVVIADNCAAQVNTIFANYETSAGSTLAVGAILFAFQIYGDFSGYSDIAIGLGRLFGFNLMQNFAFPYFSRDIAEFWRRWHISLTTWFRDYLYFPLGGSRGSKKTTIRNVFIIFLVSGLWHGANWTFVIWGLVNAVYFIPLLLLKKNRVNTDSIAKNRLLPNLAELRNILFTFTITCVAWIFFRAETVSHALGYIYLMCSSSILNPPVFSNKVILPIAILIIVEWLNRDKPHALDYSDNRLFENSIIFRWCTYLAISLLIFLLGGETQEFIYFQF